MNRLVTLTMGAAASGVLAAALPMAVAFADDYTLVPQEPEIITSTTGIAPWFTETVGTDVFGANQGNPFVTHGSFNADVTTLTTSWGFENQEILDTGGQVGGVVVPTGSFFDYASFGGGWGNEYSEIVGTMGGPNTITDMLITPFGDFNIPTTFDALALLDMPGAVIP